jgi:DNA-binding transcriptional MerR regulator
MLLRIGEFARRSGISAKTLRFYDDSGLLRPAVVDSRTRYRYYLPHQLKDLASIRAFREMGLSIPDVRQLSKSSAARLAVLEKAKVALDRSLLKTMGALSWVNSVMMEPGLLQSDVAVVLKSRPAMRVAGMVAELSSYSEIAEVERDLLRSVPQKCRGTVQGVFWHRCATSGTVVGEPFVEVNRRAVAKGFEVRDVAGASVVCAYSSVDDDEGAESAYKSIRRWMDARRYEAAGAACEIYHGRVLEIQYPVERALHTVAPH